MSDWKLCIKTRICPSIYFFSLGVIFTGGLTIFLFDISLAFEKIVTKNLKHKYLTIIGCKMFSSNRIGPQNLISIKSLTNKVVVVIAVVVGGGVGVLGLLVVVLGLVVGVIVCPRNLNVKFVQNWITNC